MNYFLTLHSFTDIGLLVLRFAVAVVFWIHGTRKLAMWKMQPSEQMPAKMLTIMKILSVAETLGAIAILAGFLTQLASIGLGIIMIGAISFKMRTLKVPFFDMNKSGWEFDFVLLAVCVLLLATGAGAIGLDRMYWGL